MDIDFHFGTVYVLARWAGFCAEDAKIIATSSQFVDDNCNENPLYLKNAMMPCTLKDGTQYKARISGHELWQNLNEGGNHHIWVPFHFLPGIQGDTISEKLICKKNSVLVNEMIEDVIRNKNKNRLYRLGVVLHVYADTWAHREFSGSTCPVNEVTGLIIIEPDINLLTKLEDRILEEIAEKKLLGHARVVHWPDRPYVKWATEERFSEGRSNWVEFLEAANSIYKVLLRFNGQMPIELPKVKQALLTRVFKELDIEDCNERNNQWIKKIRNNDFEFDEMSIKDRNIIYEKRSIENSILNHIDDEWKMFYDAIDEHYNFVKSSLETYGLKNVLE